MAVNNHYLQGELFSPGTDWITVGIYLRFSTVTPWESFDFLRISDGSNAGYHVAFRLYDSGLGYGSVAIRDADKNEIAEVDIHFQADTWYLFEIKFQKKSAPDGGVTLWIDKELAFSAANQNTNSGITFARVEVRTQVGGITPEPTGTKCQVYVKSWHVRTDDGVNILDNDTLVGHYTVLGPFNWSAPGAAGDFGDDLDSFTDWDNVKDVPKDDGTVATYTTGIQSGGVTAHDGALPGPKGSESLFDGTILAAKWFWRARKFGFQAIKMKGKYGKTQSVSTDNTTTTAEVTLTTSLQDIWELKDASDANVPGKDDWFQMGFEKTVSAGAVYVSEMWPFILHQEPSGAMPMAMDHYRRMRMA